MKVSVIISVYNRFEYVLNILRCLIEQTILPYEVILVDDGSKNNLKEYLKKFKINSKFKIKYIYQKDLGFRKSKSCNNGVLESEGEYLIFLDQDAIFPKDLIETFLQKKIKKKFSILRVLWSSFEEKEKIQENIENKEDYENLLNIISKNEKKKLKKYLLKDKYNNFRYKLGLRDRGAGLMGIGFGILKSDYENVNGYDEDYKGWGGEDADLGLRLYKSGMKSITFTTKLPSIHMCHPLDPTKIGDKNISLYNKKKKEIKTKSFRCEFGLYNRKDKDGYLYEDIKK